MSEPNYAGNIIVILSNLPEFLRKPILQKRLMEFFSMSPSDKVEIINNALAAGPTIPFDKFTRLFKTWLEVLSNFSEEHRTEMFVSYITEIIANPHKLVSFNLDGILEIFLSLTPDQSNTISNSIKNIVNTLDDDMKKRLSMIVPTRARKEFEI
ncbi:MAG TPA: hypothetical protein VJJ01_00435 [Nitrosopumilaceae archaeon]|nr:hypothetical protein [Nitrosopumilaceae archaeon]